MIQISLPVILFWFYFLRFFVKIFVVPYKLLHFMKSSISVIRFCSQFSQVKDQHQCQIWNLNTGCLSRQCYEKQLFSRINAWMLFKLLSIVYPFSATRLSCALIIKLVLKIVIYLQPGAENLSVPSLLARATQ